MPKSAITSVSERGCSNKLRSSLAAPASAGGPDVQILRLEVSVNDFFRMQVADSFLKPRESKVLQS